MRNAIILAGGVGDKVRLHSQDKPTAMISVMGRPLMACLIQWLAAYGIKQITVACGQAHDLIHQYFGDGSKLGVNINYLVEDEPLGSGGALKNALRFLSPLEEPVLVVNSDVITNLNLGDLYAYHEQRKAKVTMVTVPMQSPFGILNINDKSHVLAFSEKPELPYWINAGISLVEPSIYELLPDRGDQEIETFPLIAERGQLHAFKTQAFWRSINTVRDISELRTDMEKLFFSLFFNPASSTITAGTMKGKYDPLTVPSEPVAASSKPLNSKQLNLGAQAKSTLESSNKAVAPV